MTMTKGVRSLCALFCVLSLAGWVAANVSDTAPNVDQFMREYDGWLAASEAEAQAVRLSSPSNTRLALFGDPLQLQSNSPALKKAAPRVSDPFRFLQTSVSTTSRSSDETTKSYEKLKHFVSQVFDRVKAEQDIGDLEAKQQVILCRRNEANQRDKTLAQLELVNQLNTTLVKATSLLTELPTVITEKSATMSSERAAIFKAKAKLARIVEERTEEKKNFLSRQQALNNQIAAMDAVLDNIKKMPIEVKGQKAPKFEDKDDKAPTPKVASPFSFAAIQAATPRVSQAKTEGDGALSRDLQELASLGIVVSATTANAMASSAAPPQPPSPAAAAPVAKKAETNQKKSEDQEDHFAQLQSSLSAEIDRALGRSGAGSALMEDQDLSADREVDSIEQQLQSAMQDGRSESRQKALKAKEEAEKSIQRLQKLTAGGAPRASAPAATAAQKQAEAKALLHLSDQEMANENELLAQYNAANQNNAITGEEEAPGLLEIFSAPKPTEAKKKKKKKDDDDDDDDDDDKKKKKKNKLKEKENQLGEDEEELKLSEDENREGDVQLHAVKPKAKVDELTGVEDDLKVPDLSNAKEGANATKKEAPKSKEPPKKVVLTSASVKKLQAIYGKVTALKAVISKSLLNVVKGEVENMKSFFAKKKLARAQYDLHLTEFLKARKQLHKAQKRLAKAKVRAHRSGKGVKYNMPLFIIMKQQLKTLKKACRELEAQFAEQSEHRAKSINTTAAILKVIQDRIDGKSQPEKPEDDLTREPLPPTSIHTGKRNFSTCWDLLQAGYNVSGIYTLHDLRGHKTFQAYCDQRTNKGGWMLAFKQSDFASGSVKYNESLLGAQPLLHTKFNQSTLFSIMDYGNPKELLFRASKRSNWFTTPSFKKAYQYWEIKPTDRYCFYRPMHDTKTFELSRDWHGLEMWSDADIQLMDSFHPDISAVTVGRFYTLQKAPQCMEPHCSDQRHGRFRGKCQDGSKGEGNWMIFTR